MSGFGKAILLLALLRSPAAAEPSACFAPNCLFGCCDDPIAPPSACVANGLAGCVSDTASVSLGVRFTTSEEICVTGIKFYHEAGNQEFTTSLWWDGSSLWLEKKFYTEGGWLSATWPTPILFNPGEEFITAYTAPSGAYSYDYGYFDIDRTAGPVTFKGGENGVFGYGSNYANGTFLNSNYFVSPVWKPKWSYYVWNANTDTLVTEFGNGATVCIVAPYNLEARPNCMNPPASVVFKLAGLSPISTIVGRKTEFEFPYFVFGNLGTNVYPKRMQLPDGLYELSTTVGTETEVITFTQACEV